MLNSLGWNNIDCIFTFAVGKVNRCKRVRDIRLSNFSYSPSVLSKYPLQLFYPTICIPLMYSVILSLPLRVSVISVTLYNMTYVGDNKKMLVTESLCWSHFSMFKWISFWKWSPKRTYPNICPRHRWSFDRTRGFRQYWWQN